MDENRIMEQIKEPSEWLSTVRRYAKVNDRIDAYKIEHGIMPQFIIRGGEYATLFLHPEYATKWKGTFFDKERMFLSTALRETHSLSKYRYFEESGKRHPQSFWIVGYCDSAVGSAEGVCIHLVDPHGEVQLPPFAGMPSDMMFCYVGKMLMTRLDFTPEGVHLREVATLPFTLTERITKEHPLYDTLTE